MTAVSVHSHTSLFPPQARVCVCVLTDWCHFSYCFFCLFSELFFLSFLIISKNEISRLVTRCLYFHTDSKSGKSQQQFPSYWSVNKPEMRQDNPTGQFNSNLFRADIRHSVSLSSSRDTDAWRLTFTPVQSCSQFCCVIMIQSHNEVSVLTRSSGMEPPSTLPRIPPDMKEHDGPVEMSSVKVTYSHANIDVRSIAHVDGRRVDRQAAQSGLQTGTLTSLPQTKVHTEKSRFQLTETNELSRRTTYLKWVKENFVF